MIRPAARRRQPWGNATPTRVARLQPDCAAVIQRHDNPADASRVVHHARLLAAAGLPGPDPIGDARGRYVAWRRSAGTPGPVLLGGPQAGRLAFQMGGLARELGRLPSSRLTVDPAWQSPADLRRASTGWLDHIAADEHEIHERRDFIGRSIGRVCGAAWAPRPTHGDFVPANVLVRGRRIEALLDLTDMALRHPEVDLAWWELVVGFHHPADLARLARAFRRGYGAVDAATAERFGDVAVVRALQLVPAGDAPGRAHAVALVVAAVDAHETSRRLATIS